MGKSQKEKKDEVTDDELAELENLEGAEEPDEEETEEETPKPKKKDKKGKKDKAGKKGTKGAAKQSRAAANGKVGTQEIVNYINENGLTDKPVDGRQLRMVLRKHRGEKGIELDPETNRWEWDSMDAKPVKAIIGFVKAGEVESVKQEGLDRLKQNREDAKAKQADGDSGKKGKKKDKKKNKNK